MKGIPEIPNFITFLRKSLSNEALSYHIYKWENIIFSLLIAIGLCLVFYFGTRKKEDVPTGFHNFLEWIVEQFRHFVIGILGPDGERYVPFLGTLFIYILTMNLIGLIPFMKSPTASPNITIALAVVVFCYVQYLNIKNMGIGGFLYHLAGSPKDFVSWMIVPLMLPIEILTQLSRPVTLALRLFGNILGEKIMLGFFALMGITFFYFLPIQTPFMFLGLLTGIIQALVFTLLSTIYILLSVPHADEYH